MEKEYLIKKWLADELTPEEARAFEALEEASFFENVVESAAAFKASQFFRAEGYQTLKERLHSPETQDKKLNWIWPLMRIASVFILGFTLYYFIFYENLTEIRTQAGQKISVTLPDASSVTVNAQSQIVYNEYSWSKKREIKLEGEAFFKVARGAQFDVVTPQGTVSVLGTEFNVKQRGRFFDVQCFEGRVNVNAAGHEEILEHGDSFRFSEGKVTTGKIMYGVPQWTKSISDFNRVAVSEVFAELERQYGIEMIFENVDTDRLFTGGFVHDSLENALKSIVEPLDLEYEILPTNKVRVKLREK